MRVLLSMAVFNNLMIDCYARVHEVSSTERYPNQYRRSKDLKTHVFKHEQAGEITLAGLIKLSNLKAFKNNTNK